MLYSVKNLDCFETRSSRQIFNNVDKLAVGLSRQGVKQEDKVLFLSGSNLESLELILACFEIGAVAVPLDPFLGDDVLEGIKQRLQPACCVFDGSMKSTTRQVFCDGSLALISIKQTALAEELGCAVYQNILEQEISPLARQEVAEDHPALIIHTSGSSGNPKSILLSHEDFQKFMLCHDLTYSQYFPEDEPEEARKPLLSIFQFHHLAGLGICLQGLLSQRPVYLMPYFVPRIYLAMIEKTRTNLIMLVPSMYRHLLKDEELLAKHDLSSLQFCVGLGEATPDSLIEKIEEKIGGLHITVYGLSECYLGVIHNRENLFNKKIKRGSFGTLLFGQVKLVNSDGDEDEAEGELWIKNDTVRRCYLNDSLNDEKFEAGWYKTNDLVYRDEEGHYFHRGRCDDMFNYNGKNIYPLDVERTLAGHPAVEAVCVVGIRNEEGLLMPAALIMADDELCEQDIIDHYIRHGAVYSTPKYVQIVSKFAEVGPGKTNRTQISALLQSAYQHSLQEEKGIQAVAAMA